MDIKDDILIIIQKHLEDDSINEDLYDRMKNINKAHIVYLHHNDKAYKFTIFDVDENVFIDNPAEYSWFLGSRYETTVNKNNYTYFVATNFKNVNLVTESVNVNSFIERFGNLLLSVLEFSVNNNLIVSCIRPDQFAIVGKEFKITDPGIFIAYEPDQENFMGGTLDELRELKDYAKIKVDGVIADDTNFINSFRIHVIDKLFYFENDYCRQFALKALILRYLLIFYKKILEVGIKTMDNLNDTELDDSEIVSVGNALQRRRLNSFFRFYIDFFKTFITKNSRDTLFIVLLNFLSFDPNEIFQLASYPIEFKKIHFKEQLPDGIYNVKRRYRNDISVRDKLNNGVIVSIISLVNEMKLMFGLDFTGSMIGEIGLNNKIIASNEVGIFENSLDINNFNELKIPGIYLYKPPITDIDNFPDERINIGDIKTITFDSSKKTYCFCSDIHGTVSKLIIFFIQTKLINFDRIEGDNYIFKINKDDDNIERYVLGDYLTFKDYINESARSLTSMTTVNQFLGILSLIVAFHSTGKCTFLRGNHELIPVYKEIPFLKKLPLFKTLKFNNKYVILSHTSPYRALYNPEYKYEYKHIQNADKASKAFIRDYQQYFDELSVEYNYKDLPTSDNIYQKLYNRKNILRSVLDEHGPYYHRIQRNNKYNINDFNKYEGNFMPKNLNILSIYGHDDNESFAFYDRNGSLHNETGEFGADGIFYTYLNEIPIDDDMYNKFENEFGPDFLKTFSKTISAYINDERNKTGSLCIDTTSDFSQDEYDISNTRKNVGSYSTIGILVIQEYETNNFISLFIKSVIPSETSNYRYPTNFNIRFIKFIKQRMSMQDANMFMRNKNNYYLTIPRYMDSYITQRCEYIVPKLIGKYCILEINESDSTCIISKSEERHTKRYSEYKDNNYIVFEEKAEKVKIRRFNDKQHIAILNSDDRKSVSDLLNETFLINSMNDDILLPFILASIKKSENLGQPVQVEAMEIIKRYAPYENINEPRNVYQDIEDAKRLNRPLIKIRGGGENGKNRNIFIFTILFIVIVVLLISLLIFQSSFSKSEEITKIINK